MNSFARPGLWWKRLRLWIIATSLPYSQQVTILYHELGHLKGGLSNDGTMNTDDAHAYDELVSILNRYYDRFRGPGRQ
jgi:hypothetical protein